MNFGLVVLSWVLWICASSMNPDIPKPNWFWMGVAVGFSLFESQVININNKKDE